MFQKTAMTYICTKPLTDRLQLFWLFKSFEDQYVCWCLHFLKQWMYFSCPILEMADYKWQDQTVRLNLCALINWQIKPDTASGFFHESDIFLLLTDFLSESFLSVLTSLQISFFILSQEIIQWVIKYKTDEQLD